MPVPVFTTGEVLTAANMNAVGLWLIGSYSNSSTTTLTMDSIFSSTYAHYRIILTATGGAAATADTSFQLRVGTTPTATNYSYHTIFSSNLAGPSRAYAATQTSGQLGNFGSARSTIIVDIMNPNVAASTNWLSSWQGWGSTANYVGTTQGLQDSTNQFTGIAITNANAFTATARVYGYRN